MNFSTLKVVSFKNIVRKTYNTYKKPVFNQSLDRCFGELS